MIVELSTNASTSLSIWLTVAVPPIEIAVDTPVLSCDRHAHGDGDGRGVDLRNRPWRRATGSWGCMPSQSWT